MNNDVQEPKNIYIKLLENFKMLTKILNEQANHLLLDSYMLDSDELQLGAFRFIRGR